MTANLVTKATIPHSNAGYNLTSSADFTRMNAAGDTYYWPWSANDLVLLKTVGDATVEVDANLPTLLSITSYGGNITNPPLTLLKNKTYLFRLDPLFVAPDGTVSINTDYNDVEIDVAVLSM